MGFLQFSSYSSYIIQKTRLNFGNNVVLFELYSLLINLNLNASKYWHIAKGIEWNYFKPKGEIRQIINSKIDNF